MSTPQEAHTELTAAILAGRQARRPGGAASARDADVRPPRRERGYEPLCAVCGKRRAAVLRPRIDRGDVRASVLPQGLRIEEIGPEALVTYDPHGLLFVNVNTPHDYERARTLIELGMKPMQDRITEER